MDENSSTYLAPIFLVLYNFMYSSYFFPTHPHAFTPICPFILPLRPGLGVGLSNGPHALADCCDAGASTINFCHRNEDQDCYTHCSSTDSNRNPH